MKKGLKRAIATATCLVMVFAATSCGASFNNIGITVGNLANDGEVTSQDKVTYYINDGDIYKTEDINKEGEVIIEGDITSMNIVGEKIYFYDKSISTICKANTIGDRIERIAEVYCDKFVVAKDNIFVELLTGQGTGDMDDPDNYTIAKLKITERKLTSTMPNTVVEKGKLAGVVGDEIYTVKKTKEGKFLYRVGFDGKDEIKVMPVADDATVIADMNGIVVMGTVNGAYGVYSYTMDGKLDKTISAVTKNPSVKSNAINMDSEYIYFENYASTTVDETTTVTDSIVKVKRTGEAPEVIVSNAVAMEYHIAMASGGIMVKAKDASKVDEIAMWKTLPAKK